MESEIKLKLAAKMSIIEDKFTKHSSKKTLNKLNETEERLDSKLKGSTSFKTSQQ